MIKAVFDTVVYIRAALNHRSIWGSLVFRRDAGFHVATSVVLRAEIVDVLRRPEIARKVRFPSDADFPSLQSILERAEQVELGPIPRICRDPKDDVVLATAAAARADYLVTEDQDLLVLGEYEGTRIVDAVTFLAILDGRDDPSA